MITYNAIDKYQLIIGFINASLRRYDPDQVVRVSYYNYLSLKGSPSNVLFILSYLN